MAGVAYVATTGADYCEFDVRRTADGVFVVSHDAEVATTDGLLAIRRTTWAVLHELAPHVRLAEEVAAALAATSLRAHVDLKSTTSGGGPEGRGWECDLADLLAVHLPADRLLFTTGKRTAIAALAEWSRERGGVALVGLSIGSSTRGLGWRAALQRRRGELFPAALFDASRAGVVVPHHALATLRLTRWAARRRVPVLVWTVDRTWLLWLLVRRRRVWMVTTNRPTRAVALRDEARST